MLSTQDSSFQSLLSNLSSILHTYMFTSKSASCLKLPFQNEIISNIIILQGNTRQ